MLSRKVLARRLTPAPFAVLILLTGCTSAQPHAVRSPPPPVTALPSIREVAQSFGPAIEHGSRALPLVALTFDADMTPGMLARLRAHEVRSWYDPRIVGELRAAHVPATFFLTGLWAETYPLVANDLAHDPLFEIENHSYDHVAFEQPCYKLAHIFGTAAKRREILDGAAAISRVTGVHPRYFRFPGGCAGARDAALAATLGEQAVSWDVNSNDSFDPDPGVVVDAILSRIQPGSIVIMHLMGAPNAPATAAALQAVIPALRARGLRFVTLQRLLRA